MKGALAVAVGIVVVAAAAGGYYLGTRQGPASAASSPAAASGAGAEAKKEKKLLYYRNPMGLPDTSPVPKKDSMGMDYIAVYEGEEPAAGGSELTISRMIFCSMRFLAASTLAAAAIRFFLLFSSLRSKR